MTIGIDLGDVWSHYCTLNQDGEVVDRGRFRTTPKAIEEVVSPTWLQRGLRWRKQNTLDLDQRTVAGTGSRSHRGERSRVARDLHTVTGRAIRSMLRSWQDMPESLIRTSFVRSPIAPSSNSELG